MQSHVTPNLPPSLALALHLALALTTLKVGADLGL